MFRYWIVLFAFLTSFPSLSVDVSGIYSAKVELVSRAEADQEKAIYDAMKMVLVKIAGNREVLANSFIKSELRKNAKYLKQFNFVTENDTNKLVATFDEMRINELFVQQNIPLWGSLRPLVLFWIIKEEGLNRHIIAETEDSEIQKLMSQLAEERGLPIVLPLMDLEDSQNIFISDLWGRFVDPVKVASERYLAEKIVIVRLSESSVEAKEGTHAVSCQPLCSQTVKNIDWFMLNTQDNKMFVGEMQQGIDELTVVKDVFSDITHTISQQYALATDANNELFIDIANINTLVEYVNLTQFLKKLSSVSDVKLIQVNGSLKRFQLSLIGTKETFFSSLKFNNKLTLNEGNSVGSDANVFDQALNQYKYATDDPLSVQPSVNEESNQGSYDQSFSNNEEITNATVTIPLFYWSDE